MSEETRRARQAVPRSIFYTVVVNGILAYGIVICILFTMGSISDAVNADFPIIEICTQATGSVKAATAMVCGLLVISLSVTLASIASASRLTWAWARDGALPKWFAHVSSLSKQITITNRILISSALDRPKTQRPRACSVAPSSRRDVPRMPKHRRLSRIPGLRGPRFHRLIRLILHCYCVHGA